MNREIKKILHRPYVMYKKIKEKEKYKVYVEKTQRDIMEANQSEKKIWYFCAAIHNNLGDLAQRYCIEKWIDENYPNLSTIIIPTKAVEYIGSKIISELKNKINVQDIIIFQSGYTMSDVHPDDNVRKLILSNFKKNQYIIFPQTVLYNNVKKIKKMQKAFDNTEKMCLIARDTVSQENIKKYFNINNSKLYPDIVTTLIGTKQYNNKRSGICVCVRNDGEKYYDDKEINKLIERLKKIDNNIDLTDTNCAKLDVVNHNIIEKEIFKKIEEFSKYKVIITDRFHGTIFSLIAGTPVIVIKTNDHKVATGINWFKNVYDDYVNYCEDINDVPKIVEKYYGKELNHILAPYFKKEYYDKLKKEIREQNEIS